MASELVSMSVLPIVIIIGAFVGVSSSCDFQAICNFGDSKLHYWFEKWQWAPHHRFHLRTIATGVLETICQFRQSRFQPGANFAAGGASIRPPMLYNEGARFFCIHNTGLFGCLPANAVNKNENLDQAGCVKSKNDMAQYFNSQLKDRLNWLKTKLTGSVFTYVDLYSAKYALISDAKNQGFADAIEFCGGSCSNKSPHISWDGIPYSWAANQWVAKRIISGSYSDPSISVNQACQHA